MDMLMLAEITSKWDFSGVWCLASILFLAIAILAYSTGPWSGSCICAILFILTILITGDGVSDHPNTSYIGNASRSKMMLKPVSGNLNLGMMIFADDPNQYGQETLWIPPEELMLVDSPSGNTQIWKMKPNGREIGDDDWYRWDYTFDPVNVAVEHGGSGVPQWLYHSASPIVIFGLGGLPSILVCGLVIGKLRG
jgi:hypothetical protein